MRIFEIKAYDQVGLVKFGMERMIVREILGDFKEFKKTKASINTTDDFTDCHVFYNKKNLCEAIEIFNEAKALIDGTDLLKLSYEDFKELLLKYDSDLKISDDSLISKKIGVSVYTPNFSVESILVFSKEYFV